MTDPRTAWRKSSRSGGQTSCVELHRAFDRVRDSKNPTGPVLRVDAAAFVEAVKADRIG